MATSDVACIFRPGGGAPCERSRLPASPYDGKVIEGFLNSRLRFVGETCLVGWGGLDGRAAVLAWGGLGEWLVPMKAWRALERAAARRDEP